MKFVDKKLKEFRDRFSKTIEGGRYLINDPLELEQFIKEALEEAHMEGVRDISKIYGVTIPDDARMAKLKSEQEECPDCNFGKNNGYGKCYAHCQKPEGKYEET